LRQDPERLAARAQAPAGAVQRGTAPGQTAGAGGGAVGAGRPRALPGGELERGPPAAGNQQRPLGNPAALPAASPAATAAGAAGVRRAGEDPDQGTPAQRPGGL